MSVTLAERITPQTPENTTSFGDKFKDWAVKTRQTTKERLENTFQKGAVENPKSKIGVPTPETSTDISDNSTQEAKDAEALERFSRQVRESDAREDKARPAKAPKKENAPKPDDLIGNLQEFRKGIDGRDPARAKEATRVLESRTLADWAKITGLTLAGLIALFYSVGFLAPHLIGATIGTKSILAAGAYGSFNWALPWFPQITGVASNVAGPAVVATAETMFGAKVATFLAGTGLGVLGGGLLLGAKKSYVDSQPNTRTEILDSKGRPIRQNTKPLDRPQRGEGANNISSFPRKPTPEQQQTYPEQKLIEGANDGNGPTSPNPKDPILKGVYRFGRDENGQLINLMNLKVNAPSTELKNIGVKPSKAREEQLYGATRESAGGVQTPVQEKPPTPEPTTGKEVEKDIESIKALFETLKTVLAKLDTRSKAFTGLINIIKTRSAKEKLKTAELVKLIHIESKHDININRIKNLITSVAEYQELFEDNRFDRDNSKVIESAKKFLSGVTTSIESVSVSLTELEKDLLALESVVKPEVATKVESNSLETERKVAFDLVKNDINALVRYLSSKKLSSIDVNTSLEAFKKDSNSVNNYTTFIKAVKESCRNESNELKGEVLKLITNLNTSYQYLANLKSYAR